VLGLVRAPDAPVFGTDVSLQKARTVAFFSNPVAAQQLLDDIDAEVPEFVARARAFFNDPAALTGRVAFGARSIGNISRPHFPDGEVARGHGPFSRPIEDFSPLATGLQVALIKSNLLQHALFVEQLPFTDTAQQCTLVPPAPSGQRRLANGIQIFSGRGTDLSRQPARRRDRHLGRRHRPGRHGSPSSGSTTAAPAPVDRQRAARDARDNVVINVGAGVRLRYVNCPFAPFLDTAAQNVCQGL
jgi:hypothetical protein